MQLIWKRIIRYDVERDEFKGKWCLPTGDTMPMPLSFAVTVQSQGAEQKQAATSVTENPLLLCFKL